MTTSPSASTHSRRRAVIAPRSFVRALTCVVSCFVLLLGVVLAGNAPAAERPNVIFIFADDLGYGDLQCHRDDLFRSAPPQPNGNRPSDEWRGDVLTPHLDRLAREGTDFQQFMVCSPVCAPSRVAAMTGQFPSRNRVHHVFTNHAENVRRGMPDYLSPSTPLLPKQLKAAGYRTAHFGKWHLGNGDDAPPPSEYGFDSFKIYSGPGPHVFDGTPYANMHGDAHGEDAASFLSVAATDHATRFIRDHKDSPFYLNLWLHETHAKVTARPQDRVGYEDVPEPYQTYYGAVSRLDAQVGRVLDLLDELDLAANTLVMFSSDNGPENFNTRLPHSVGSPAGMRGRKRSLMMGGLNVPFLCRWPDVIPAGRVDKQIPLAAVDLMPTILAATAATPPANYESDGENVLAAFRGEPFQRTKTMFWYWIGNHGKDNWPVLGARRGSFALLRDPAADRTELYDVVSDRFQQQDLSRSRPELARQLLNAIDEWMESLPELPDPYNSVTGRKASTGGQPAAKKSAIDRPAVFDRKDTDQDGYLNLEEFARHLRSPPPPEQRFKRFDKNQDGKLSKQEFTQP